MNATAGTGPEDGYDAAPFVPEGADLARLRSAAAGCRGCPLHLQATQTVFGAGEPSSAMVLVGEQPGDVEDRRGRPFVGPAGKVLDRALAEAGIDPGEVYVTNAVKHFKFVLQERGKRRMHEAPSRREVTACRPWLVAELRLVSPRVVVALGATAAKALLGPSFRVTREHGVVLPLPPLDGVDPEVEVVATTHPSAVLRADDRESVYAGMVADLRVAAGVVGGG
ncbi:UdgX family uracil-DNA binding protein [Peterkaempfera griseoplana]|uniref:UdgX family uracil-DNA binding protein n=1 Tax=Peterkaempfera griseoplana TaxID=66896 RepID=UPI0006E39253|nr:UdgX family uracil-DNA binding protein [Peterkaempfera griseoplana]